MKTPKNPEVIAVVGGQWGDEGKGKIVDYLASDSDVVIRAQGGDNAGHTVINDRGKFALHLVPAGIFNSSTVNIIGAGVALNPKTLLREISELTSRGVAFDNLIISPKAHLAFDYHLYLDRQQEDAKGVRKIETTKRGIGPTYMDKAERIGLQARLLLKPDLCLEILDRVLAQKRQYYGIAGVAEFETSYYEKLITEASQKLGSMIRDTESLITNQLSDGKRFVIEGAHATLLDLDHGTYPMVTASNTTIGGLLVGAGMPALKLTKVVGVIKAYQTRVGAGGMPTELSGKQAELIREKGHEYGTTTGRPRRVGYFDGVAAGYANQINGFTDIAITRLDTLAVVGDLKICNQYRNKNETITQFNTDNDFLSECQSNYRPSDEYLGWSEDLSQVKTIDGLPQSVQKYIAGISQTLPGARISYLGVGESRRDLIVV